MEGKAKKAVPLGKIPEGKAPKWGNQGVQRPARPVEVETTMVEAMRGYKMAFRIPDGLGTR